MKRTKESTFYRRELATHEREKKTRLIAAAPELLEACKVMLRGLEIAFNRAEGDLLGIAHNDTVDAMTLAARAIANAEGRA